MQTEVSVALLSLFSRELYSALPFNNRVIGLFVRPRRRRRRSRFGIIRPRRKRLSGLAELAQYFIAIGAGRRIGALERDNACGQLFAGTIVFTVVQKSFRFQSMLLCALKQ